MTGFFHGQLVTGPAAVAVSPGEEVAVAPAAAAAAAAAERAPRGAAGVL